MTDPSLFAGVDSRPTRRNPFELDPANIESKVERGLASTPAALDGLLEQATDAAGDLSGDLQLVESRAAQLDRTIAEMRRRSGLTSKTEKALEES